MAKKRILVVEDEAVTAADIEDELLLLGYEVIGLIANGQKAIEAAISEVPDLVLMDIRLQGPIDGITAAAQIWDVKKIPIVFLTAHADEATLSRAKLVNPYGYILKPFEEAELRTAIELAFNRLDSEGAHRRNLDKHSPSRIAENIELGSKSLSKTDFLRRIDVFSKLSPSAMDELGEAAQFVELEAGQTLSYEGEESSPCFIVASGRISMVLSTSEGKELTVGLLPPGDALGVACALQDEPLPFSAKAQRDSRVLCFPRSLIQTVLKSESNVYRELLDVTQEHFSSANKFALLLAHENVETRIGFALQKIVDNFGVFNRDLGYYLVDLTRQELADLAGTTPETAIRITKQMERRGELDLSTPGVIGLKEQAKLL